jgi:hypothetical protein
MLEELLMNHEPAKQLELRDQLNGTLGVADWLTPVDRRKLKPAVSEGPWWWRGDEDASQGFLTAMGVKL